jgi:ADP-heptose:LPS heptosyltransferase
MTTKKKPSMRQQNKAMKHMLKSLGMGDSVDDMVAADLEDIRKAGEAWNKEHADGMHAKGVLNDLKRDTTVDYEAMKVPTLNELEHVDTVDQFKELLPSFCIAEAILDFELQVPDGTKRAFKQGQRVCLVPPAYERYNKMRPCLKPSFPTFRDVYKRYDGQDLTGKTIMAWRAGGVGDLLFIRPILVYLKKKYDCKVIFATKARYHDLVRYWDDAIDALADVDFDVSTTLDVSDYHLTFEGLIERCRDANRMDVHELFAKYAGVDPDEVEWSVPITVPVDNAFFAGNTGKYVVIQPRASAPTRTPYIGTFVQIANACTKRGYRVVLADSPVGVRLCDEIRHACETPDMVVNFARYSGGLHDVVPLVDGAEMVISPDSAFTHLAAMQGKPCVALYGPFPARVRTAIYPQCIAIDLPPSKCCDHGGKECFLHATIGQCKVNEQCWSNVEHDVVLSTINQTLDTLEADNART